MVPPPSPPGYGYFADPNGTSTSDGSIVDPWDLQTALDGGYPASTVGAGDTVWLRGGTYTAPFTCELNGSAGNLITFRGYPGERPTIDGTNVSAGNAILKLSNFGSYVIIRDIEVMNSNVNRWQAGRDDGVMILMPHSKVINCVVHDSWTSGIGDWTAGEAAEVYGNLVYHNGYWAYYSEEDGAAAIDLIPSGGSAVALSGSSSYGRSASPVTVSHNQTGADPYLVVAVNKALPTGSYVDILSATYDGTAMTLLTGVDSGLGALAIFGIAGHAGTHDIVVTSTEGGYYPCVIAQSFANVHQSTAPSVGGTWTCTSPALPPFGADTTSAANHMVVDGIAIYGSYSEGQDYAPSGDNTGNMIGGAVSGGNAVVRLSYASGAATVDMSWDWTPLTHGYGHGIYAQENVGGKLISDNIFYDQVGDNCIQCYGTSGSDFLGSSVTGNAFVGDGVIFGGLSSFDLTGSTADSNYMWATSQIDVGFSMDHLTDFEFTNNTTHPGIGLTDPLTWDALVMTGNTFVGPTDNFDSGDFPTNDYYTLGSPPTTNVVIVRANSYETNRANVYVYNWENLTSVSVDLTGAVANGTQIFVMNAQNYYATPVWSGTYNGGSISIPMTNLTAAAGIGYTAEGTFGPAFGAFIVREKTNEYWRLLA